MAGGYRVGRNRGPRQPPLYIYEVSASDRERTRKPVIVFWFISGKGAASIIEYYNERFKRGTRFVAFGRWEWDGRRNTFSLKLAKPDELELLPSVAPETLDFEAEIEPAAESTSDENNDELLEDLGSPEFANIHTSRQVPVYRKLGPFQTKRLREIIFAVLNDLDASSVPENLPAETAKRHDLIPRSQAISEIHFPPTDLPIACVRTFVSPAQKRLIFDEFFWLSLALQLRRGTRKEEKKGAVIELAKNFRDRARNILQFNLTDAQKRVIGQILDDITSDTPMNRLAPGRCRQRQDDRRVFGDVRRDGERLSDGIDGTDRDPRRTACPQCPQDLRTDRLQGLAADRQHKGGGKTQGTRRDRRGRIAYRHRHARDHSGRCVRSKNWRSLSSMSSIVSACCSVRCSRALGHNPDILVMTATPIPRSLAMTVYGDLDVSIIDELPPGRTPIKTVVLGEDQRSGVYKGIEREIARPAGLCRLSADRGIGKDRSQGRDDNVRRPARRRSFPIAASACFTAR